MILALNLSLSVLKFTHVLDTSEGQCRNEDVVETGGARAADQDTYVAFRDSQCLTQFGFSQLTEDYRKQHRRQWDLVATHHESKQTNTQQDPQIKDGRTDGVHAKY